MHSSSMNIWVESLGRNFEAALGLLDAAIRDCTDELWESSMWPVPAPSTDSYVAGPDGQPLTDTAARHALAQRWSSPWGVAWHALEILDYDLTGEFAPWSPPPPFSGKAHWRDLTMLPSPWTRPEILGYIEKCRERARDALAVLTDGKAATPLPPTHRYQGQPFAWLLTSIPGHTIEHASQIRQFITAAGIPPAS